jgi:hypothetical protein
MQLNGINQNKNNMEINLKSNSWHSKLYKWTYNAYILPSSLCNYFWGLVFAIVSIPLTIWSLPHTLMKIRPGDYFVRLLQSLFTIFLLLLIIVGVSVFIKNPIAGLKLTGQFLAAIACMIAIAFIPDGIKKTKWSITKTDSYKIVAGQALSVKKKVCPKINWE